MLKSSCFGECAEVILFWWTSAEVILFWTSAEVILFWWMRWSHPVLVDECWSHPVLDWCWSHPVLVNELKSSCFGECAEVILFWWMYWSHPVSVLVNVLKSSCFGECAYSWRFPVAVNVQIVMLRTYLLMPIMLKYEANPRD